MKIEYSYQGWLALLGGGEFSFGETLAADRAWVELAPPGPIGFIPAASDSADYGRHFSTYMEEAFQREVEVIPVYRARDDRRGKNCERIAAVSAVYIGGGVSDHLLEALSQSPAAAALAEKLQSGGVIATIAAAAQATGHSVRSIFGGKPIAGLGWLPGAAIETNFDPGHDRRLRLLLRQPGVTSALGIPASGALLLGPQGEVRTIGPVFAISQENDDLAVLGGDFDSPGADAASMNRTTSELSEDSLEDLPGNPQGDFDE